MKLQQIELFIAVYENRSIARAAHELYLTQQAVSKSIRELEEEINCVLFTRHSSGVIPTEYGDFVYTEFKKATTILVKIPLHIAELKSSIRETIKIGMAYGVIDSIGISVINYFTSLYPNICLEVSDDPDIIIEEKLAHGILDIAFVIEPVDRSSFDVVAIKSEPMVLSVCKGHPLFNKKKISVDELRGQKFININPIFKGRHNLQELCKKAGFEPEFAYNANLVFATKEFSLGEEMSKNSQVLNIVPAHKVKENLPGIRYVPFEDPPLEWRISLAIRKDETITDGIRVFREYLLSQTW